jgi:hypothetical protein
MHRRSLFRAPVEPRRADFWSDNWSVHGAELNPGEVRPLAADGELGPAVDGLLRRSADLAGPAAAASKSQA